MQITALAGWFCLLAVVIGVTADECVTPSTVEDYLALVDATGHATFDLGNYDRCVIIPDAEYCLLTVAGVMYGVCLPEACASDAALRNASNGLYIPFLTEQIPLLLVLAPDPDMGSVALDCGAHAVGWSFGSAMTLSVIGVLVLLAVCGTMLHAALRRRAAFESPGCVDAWVLWLAGVPLASAVPGAAAGWRCPRSCRCLALMCCGATAAVGDEDGGGGGGGGRGASPHGCCRCGGDPAAGGPIKVRSLGPPAGGRMESSGSLNGSARGDGLGEGLLGAESKGGWSDDAHLAGVAPRSGQGRVSSWGAGRARDSGSLDEVDFGVGGYNLGATSTWRGGSGRASARGSVADGDGRLPGGGGTPGRARRGSPAAPRSAGVELAVSAAAAAAATAAAAAAVSSSGGGGRGGRRGSDGSSSLAGGEGMGAGGRGGIVDSYFTASATPRAAPRKAGSSSSPRGADSRDPWSGLRVCPCLLSFSLLRSCRRLAATSPSGRDWAGRGARRAGVSAPSAVAGVRVLSVLVLAAGDSLRASRHVGLSNPLLTQFELEEWPAVVWMSLAECAADVLLMAAGFLVALPPLRRVAIVRAMRRDAAIRRLATSPSAARRGRRGGRAAPRGCCGCGAGDGSDGGWDGEDGDSTDSWDAAAPGDRRGGMGGGTAMPGNAATRRAARGCFAPGGLRSAAFVLVHRALRFLPLTAAVMFLEWTVVPLVASGPFWGGWARLGEECDKWGWASLVFAANAAPSSAPGGFAAHQCVSSSWLLSVEMQLALVVLPVVLGTYKAHAAAGLCAAVSLLAGFVGVTAAVVGAFGLHMGPFVAPGEGAGTWGGSGSGAPLKTVDLYYVTPWARGSGFVVGVLLAMAWVWMETAVERRRQRRRDREARRRDGAHVAGVSLATEEVEEAARSHRASSPRRRGVRLASNQSGGGGGGGGGGQGGGGGRGRRVVASASDDERLFPPWAPWCLLATSACIVVMLSWGGIIRAVASADAAAMARGGGLTPAAARTVGTPLRPGWRPAPTTGGSSFPDGQDVPGWPINQRGTEVAYMVLARPAAALAAALACLASFAGGGGPVRSVLEWSGWQPLARLTYAAILTEPAVLRVLLLSRTQWVRHSSIELLTLWLANVTLTFLAAAVLYLVVEGPAVAVEAAALASCGCSPPEELALLSARAAARQQRTMGSAGGNLGGAGKDGGGDDGGGGGGGGGGRPVMQSPGGAWWERDLGAAFLEDAGSEAVREHGGRRAHRGAGGAGGMDERRGHARGASVRLRM